MNVGAIIDRPAVECCGFADGFSKIAIFSRQALSERSYIHFETFLLFDLLNGRAVSGTPKSFAGKLIPRISEPPPC